MLNPHLFRDLLTMERHIVDVSRAAEALRRYIEGVEIAGGDVSQLRNSLHQMLSAMDLLRAQRNEIASEVRKMGDFSWAAKPSAPTSEIHIVGAGVSPVGREPTPEGCCDF